MRARSILLLALLLAVLAGGCGSEDAGNLADRAREEARQRADRLRASLERRTDRLRRRIEEALGDLERAVPRAERTSPEVQARGRTGTTTIDAFLTDVLGNVDAYWTRTLRASGLPEPAVGYVWIPPGRRVATGCGATAGDDAAFYCPRDDTIYVAQRFAVDLHRGALPDLPGERAGYGRATGDFGVAYVVAHEYAHNVQHELGLFSLGGANSSEPIELQADCMAGSWGASVYAEGRLQPGDIEEAVGTALAVGDFDVSSRNHHGTPQQRREAWLTGFESDDPSVCSRFAPG
jgi:uncharacterized protein